MNIKKTFFLVIFVGGSCVAFQTNAQEGDPIQPEERPGEVIILPDSSQHVDPKEAGYEEVGDVSSDNIYSDSDQQLPQVGNVFMPVPKKNTLVESKPVVTEKDKQKESRNDMSFNILYYIFYKFKKVENYD